MRRFGADEALASLGLVMVTLGLVAVLASGLAAEAVDSRLAVPCMVVVMVGALLLLRYERRSQRRRLLAGLQEFRESVLRDRADAGLPAAERDARLDFAMARIAAALADRDNPTEMARLVAASAPAPATTPEPPYAAAILVRHGEAPAIDRAAAEDLRAAPGFLGLDRARGLDGAEIAVAYFADPADFDAWAAKVGRDAPLGAARDRLRLARVERSESRPAGSLGF